MCRARIRVVLSVLLTLCVAALSGRGGGGGGSGGDAAASSTGSSALRVVVTDAPFSFGDVTSATVDVERIDLHQRGAGEDTLQTLVTFSPARQVDLVHLRNGVSETLYEGNPPPGDYDAVRVVVQPREIAINDAGAPRSFPFTVPSGPRTGIKVQVSPSLSVLTSLTTDLVLDFDLSRSFVVQGNPGTPTGIKGFHFKLVVRATNASTAGSLTLLVKGDGGTPENALDAAALDGAVCTLTDAAASTVASAVAGPKPGDANIHGFVLLPAIPAGTYTLTVTATGYDVYRTPATLAAANLTDLHAVTLARSPAITGTVTTSLAPKTGEALQFAVEGALVSSGSVSDTTDSAGGYQLPGLAPGTYPVTVQKAGYAPFSGTGTSWAGATAVSSNFTLVPLVSSVTGTVRNALGVAVVGAAVTVSVAYAGASVVIAQATSDANGTYALTLSTGSYQIGVGAAAAALDVVGPTPVTRDLTAP